MSQTKLKYRDFAHRINLDAFYEAIGWTPERTQGDNDIGFCVFPENHANGDTTGKFGIHREKMVYNCYVCGGGTILSLAMELKDLEIEPAQKWLYQFCDEDTRSDEAVVDDFLEYFQDIEDRAESMPYFNERVLNRFDDPIENAGWLEQRGIHRRTAELYGVRYTATNYRPAPKSGRFSEDEDYMGPAIILPHYWDGRLVGWQSRWLDEDRPEWVPKYTMTSEFPKENTVYGMDNLRHTGFPVVIVESVPSVLFLHSCGYASVATFGSSVNPAQLRVLRRFQKGVVLAPDNDEAGAKWARQIHSYLNRYINVRVLPPLDKTGSDIADLASSCDPEVSVDEYLWGPLDPQYEALPGL